MERYKHRDVQFVLDGPISDARLPGELFDSVADNLIENAFNKSAEVKKLNVQVVFSAAGRGSLVVRDNGPAVGQQIANELFNAPVRSNTGFGVGLYQSSRLATDLGYVLSLAVNEPGNVHFTLGTERSRHAPGAHHRT
jgi:C4-dicarboxylate-specific signal transduction histidine kinase